MPQPSLEDALLSYLQAPGYQPQDASGIARGMGVAPTERPALRTLLRDWEAQGRLVRLRQARYHLRTPLHATLEGKVRTLPSGKKLFIPNAAGQEELAGIHTQAGVKELPIPRLRTLGAMDGDTVRVSIRRTAPQSYRRHHKGQRPIEGDLRWEARVEEILSRRQGTWVGIYRQGGRYGAMRGDGTASPELVYLQEPPPPELQVGMCIAVKPHTYPIGKMPATGCVAEVLGWPEEEGVDMRAIIHRHGLRAEFPPAALEEARSLPEQIPPGEYARRADWRSLCVFTIDPETARDYDDAISLRRLEDGWELAVHIADVSYYVKPGSALDREARLRGNSTYLPDRVLPMLPPRLSDELCSLKEGADRLTKLCLMRINSRGKVTKADFHDAIIRSRRRLTYAQALEVLTESGSTGDAEVDSMIREGSKLAHLLRTQRFKAGALDLEMPEIRVLLDDHGIPIGVEKTQSDAAHQLIEEFMLAANEQVARALKQHMIPALYRVHEEPDPGKLHEFALIARSYGIPAGTLSTREELTRTMQHFQGHPDELLIKVSLLRAMMRARYSPQALGHYGLAKGDYCHFTSPIRRYADLIIHRGFSRLTSYPGPKPGLPTGGKLAEIAEHISETERTSAAAEQEAEQLKLHQFMELQCHAENPLVWQALITAAWPQGLAAEIPELQMKGFISGSMLPDDARWFHERHAGCWSSTDGRRILPGHSLPVVPVRIDPATGFLELRPVSMKK